MSRRRASYQPYEPTDPAAFYAAHYGTTARRQDDDAPALPVAPDERLSLGSVTLAFGAGILALNVWPLACVLVRWWTGAP